MASNGFGQRDQIGFLCEERTIYGADCIRNRAGEMALLVTAYSCVKLLKLPTVSSKEYRMYLKPFPIWNLKSA